jgi:hypothetical protein
MPPCFVMCLCLFVRRSRQWELGPKSFLKKKKLPEGSVYCDTRVYYSQPLLGAPAGFNYSHKEMTFHQIHGRGHPNRDLVIPLRTAADAAAEAAEDTAKAAAIAASVAHYWEQVEERAEAASTRPLPAVFASLYVYPSDTATSAAEEISQAVKASAGSNRGRASSKAQHKRRAPARSGVAVNPMPSLVRLKRPS